MCRLAKLPKPKKKRKRRNEKVIYVRRWACAVCGEALIIDTVKLTQSCGCNTSKLSEKERIGAYIKTFDFLKNYEVLSMSPIEPKGLTH